MQSTLLHQRVLAERLLYEVHIDLELCERWGRIQGPDGPETPVE